MTVYSIFNTSIIPNHSFLLPAKLIWIKRKARLSVHKFVRVVGLILRGSSAQRHGKGSWHGHVHTITNRLSSFLFVLVLVLTFFWITAETTRNPLGSLERPFLGRLDCVQQCFILNKNSMMTKGNPFDVRLKNGRQRSVFFNVRGTLLPNISQALDSRIQHSGGQRSRP